MASILRSLWRVLAPIALSLHAGVACAEPESGWWWNPSESGRGFFIEMTAGVIYVGGYFYTEDGRATWVSSGGPLTDPWHYQGTLQAYHGGQTLFGEYRPPAPSADVGPITVHFTDDLHGTITWPGGTIPIERQIFGTGAAPFQPGTGWWWNESESGRGYSVEIQGGNAFVVSFMYDDDGNAVWYFSAGPMITPTHYEGDILRFSGGQTLTGPYQPPRSPDTIGRMTVDFLTPDEADLTFEDVVPDKARATSSDKSFIRRKSTRVRRQFIPSVGPLDHWPFWRFNMTRVDTQVVGSFTHTLEHKYAGWFRLASVTPAGSATYTLDRDASALITYHGKDLDSGCVLDGQTLFSVQTGTLSITNRLAYSGTVGVVEPAPYNVAFRIVCPNGGGNGGQYPFFVADAFGGASSFVTVWYSALDLRPYIYQPIIVGDRTIELFDTTVRLGWVLGATAQRPADPPQP
jgi:hypothetical protein